jgi:hypothetical protein
MTLLRAWIFCAALVLVISLSVHLMTFSSIDPMRAIPGVMLIHIAIFPPFIAAIVYAKKINPSNQNDVWKLAPQWMQRMSAVFFVYGIVNFIIFLILVHGGGPQIRDGKYVLADHGHIIRQLSEPEYHQMQAYVVRGFSGHWMLFSSAALTILTAVYIARSNQPSTDRSGVPEERRN